MGKILSNFFFLLKLCHIQLNYAFLMFWSILGQIHRELIFLVKNMAISERSSEIPRKFVFLNTFEKLNHDFLLFLRILGKIHCELLFLVKKVAMSQRWTKILGKFVFLNMFEKGKILRKIWICLNNCFWSNQYKGRNITKKLGFV